MELNAHRSVEQSIVTSTITISAFGSSTMTAEDEMEILNDYKLTLDTGKILFSRFVAVNDHKDPVIVNVDLAGENDTQEPAAENDLVTLAIPIQTYDITPDVEIKYAVDVRDVENKLGNYHVIEDAACLAKAMVLVFEDVVITWIKEQLEVSKNHKDDFESDVTYVI